MAQANYTLERVLQLIRASFHERPGDLKYQIYLQRLWKMLEDINDPGVVKPRPDQAHLYGPYLYDQSPSALREAAIEGFYHLLNTGYVCPKPDGIAANHPRSEWYRWTERGRQWIEGAEPIPEEVAGYMRFLREQVPTLDGVIEQYILEALTAFNRDAYFAAAVMTGAASEKAMYLLAESLLNALKPSARRNKLETAQSRRQLFTLLDLVRRTIEDCSVGNPAPIPYSATEGVTTHLASLFEAVRTQRNDAVHPMNATVSASSVRLLLHSFPYALGSSEKLRSWLNSHPGTL